MGTVQVLTDLDLLINKSYVSSDGVWFMEGQYKLYNLPFITKHTKLLF